MLTEAAPRATRIEREFPKITQRDWTICASASA